MRILEDGGTIGADVMMQLRHDIVDGRYAPGAKLKFADLQSAYAAGIGTARLAFFELPLTTLDEIVPPARNNATNALLMPTERDTQRRCLTAAFSAELTAIIIVELADGVCDVNGNAGS